MIDNKVIVQINRFIQTMPPLSISVNKIIEISKDPNVDAKKLNDIISIDPVLTGKVLRLINSAYYSLPNQVTSLVRAIIMLGINTIKNLVLSTGVLTSISEKTFLVLDVEAFWRHSVCVGAMAKSLALKQGINPKVSEEYFVGGLLHDIGKIPFNAVLPEHYKSIIDTSKSTGRSIQNIESEVFDINHNDLGFRIAQHWKLNLNLSNAIRFHHNVEEVSGEEQKFVATIALANLIANKVGISATDNVIDYKNEEHLLKVTGLTHDDVVFAESTAEEALKKAEVFLKVSK